MKYAIIYSSKTGNAELLAKTIKNTLNSSDCIYYGTDIEMVKSAGRIYLGFWTDKGMCDSTSINNLKALKGKEVFLFGTAGFGESEEYFKAIMEKTIQNLSSDNKVIGSFMCQGKMPISVRERYEMMAKSSSPVPNINILIENFDKALTHPDENDLEKLKSLVSNT